MSLERAALVIPNDAAPVSHSVRFFCSHLGLACDTEAKKLVGGKVILSPCKGNCSYSVYAGPEFEFVVQFRLKSLMLRSEIVTLARQIYGPLAPNAEFHGQLGEDGREFLLIQVMNRIPGISYLEFVLANGFPENSDDNFVWRKTLMSDVARYISPPSFLTPQIAPQRSFYMS